MRAPRVLIAVACGVGAIVWLASCRGVDTPLDPPSQTTLSLFELATQREPDETLVESLFEVRDDDAWRAGLYDALGQLAGVGRVEIEGVVQLEGLDRTAVDVVGTVGADGQARYSVQLTARDAGDWKIVSFDGPGVSWPPRRRPRGAGLSTWPDGQR